MNTRRDRVARTSSCTATNVTPINCSTSTDEKRPPLLLGGVREHRESRHREMKRISKQDEQAETPKALHQRE